MSLIVIINRGVGFSLRGLEMLSPCFAIILIIVERNEVCIECVVLEIHLNKLNMECIINIVLLVWYLRQGSRNGLRTGWSTGDREKPLSTKGF